MEKDDFAMVLGFPGSTERFLTSYGVKEALDISDEKLPGTIFLIPINFDPCQPPHRLRHLQWVNLYEDDGYNKLLHSLRYRADQLGSNIF